MAGEQLFVRAQALRIRKGPNADSGLAAMRRLRLGEAVETLSDAEGDYIQIRSRGYFTKIQGWVAHKYLVRPSSYPVLEPERFAKDFAAFAARVKTPAKDVPELIKALLIGLPAAGVVTPRRIAHFMAQCAHESGLKPTSEGLLYRSIEGVLGTFGANKFDAGPRKGERIFPGNDAERRKLAQSLVKNPQKLANFVYCWKNGNGDEQSGDGFKYIGRGLIQLTGRKNYEDVGDRIAHDLVGQPKLLETPAVAALSACGYWARADEESDINRFADEDDLEGVTRLINKRLLHLDQRRIWLQAAKRIWRDVEVEAAPFVPAVAAPVVAAVVAEAVAVTSPADAAPANEVVAEVEPIADATTAEVAEPARADSEATPAPAAPAEPPPPAAEAVAEAAPEPAPATLDFESPPDATAPAPEAPPSDPGAPASTLGEVHEGGDPGEPTDGGGQNGEHRADG